MHNRMEWMSLNEVCAPKFRRRFSLDVRYKDKEIRIKDWDKGEEMF